VKERWIGRTLLDTFSAEFIQNSREETVNCVLLCMTMAKKNILINIKTKKCTPKSVLRWEFASVYFFVNIILSCVWKEKK